MSFTHCNHNIYYYIPIHDLYVIQVKNTTSQISYPVSCCGLKSHIKLPPCVINYCVVMLNWCDVILRLERNVKHEIKCPTNKKKTISPYWCIIVEHSTHIETPERWRDDEFFHVDCIDQQHSDWSLLPDHLRQLVLPVVALQRLAEPSHVCRYYIENSFFRSFIYCLTS